MARFQLGTISTEQVWGLAPYSPTVSSRGGLGARGWGLGEEGRLILGFRN